MSEIVEAADRLTETEIDDVMAAIETARGELCVGAAKTAGPWRSLRGRYTRAIRPGKRTLMEKRK